MKKKIETVRMEIQGTVESGQRKKSREEERRSYSRMNNGAKKGRGEGGKVWY